MAIGARLVMVLPRCVLLQMFYWFDPLVIINDVNIETKKVAPYSFTMEVRMFALIDTPGFNDTTPSDWDVLVKIADWLEDSYQEKRLLNGILYLHPETDRPVLPSCGSR